MNKLVGESGKRGMQLYKMENFQIKEVTQKKLSTDLQKKTKTHIPLFCGTLKLLEQFLPWFWLYFVPTFYLNIFYIFNNPGNILNWGHTMCMCWLATYLDVWVTVHHAVPVVLTHIMCCKHYKNKRCSWVWFFLKSFQEFDLNSCPSASTVSCSQRLSRKR